MAYCSKLHPYGYLVADKPPLKYLMHHGIKGQKWGVRRGPPYPLSDGRQKEPGKSVAKSSQSAKIEKGILQEAIRNGEVSLKLNLGAQKKHLPNRADKGRSYILGNLADAQRLVLELSGTGELIITEGVWRKKERVTASEKIGVYVSEDGTETRTSKLIIIYGKKGTHIYAAKVKKL